MKHTPKPWGCCYDGSGTWSVGPEEDPQTFTIASVNRWRRDDETARADAYLIAAAPDLLEALRPFAAMVHPDGVDAPYPEDIWKPLLDAAARAVAKAEVIP
jgi:hypothetical protein